MKKIASFNALNRQNTINNATSNVFDVIVIGGGITGAGILLDASSRGFNTLLLEKSDFASGTSSRSTKLIHGGLRYLKNFEFKIVRETGRERAILQKNAPHLVIPEKLLIPLTKKGTFKKWQLNWALRIYDILAKVKGEDKRKMLNKKATLLHEPIINSKDLIGAGTYAEYRTDDARLTLEIIKTALHFNGTAINYFKVIDINKQNNIYHLTCLDKTTQKQFEITSKSVVNATGPWVDNISQLDLEGSPKRICLSKGIHIVIKKEKLPINNSIYFEIEDGRLCFAIPRDKVVYVGTTDTAYNGKKDEPEINKGDVNYLLDALNKTFNKNLKKSDIKSCWSGLRPLIKKEGVATKELSRKDEISISESGMITIAGGKLTGYRLMAKKIVDLICRKHNIKKNCNTENIMINGSSFSDINELNNKISGQLTELEIKDYNANYLINNYGDQTLTILEIYKKNHFKHIAEAEAIFCLKNESLLNPLDFFLRRTGKIYFYPDNILNELEIVMPHFIQYLSINNQEAEQMKKEVKIYLENLTKFSE